MNTLLEDTIPKTIEGKHFFSGNEMYMLCHSKINLLSLHRCLYQLSSLNPRPLSGQEHYRHPKAYLFTLYPVLEGKHKQTRLIYKLIREELPFSPSCLRKIARLKD